MICKRVASTLTCIVVLAAVVCGTALTACGTAAPPVQTPTAPAATTVPPTPTSETTPTSAPEVEQSLVLAMELGPRMLDSNDQAQWSMLVYRLMYDPLVRADATGALVPALAESWEAVDATTWRFHLRQGVTFHNGEPFDAESVKWTVEFSLDPDNNRMALSGRGVRDIQRVEVVDDYTVDLITAAPSALVPTYLVYVDMLPAQYYTEVGSDAFNEAPVGTGMFKHVDSRIDEYILLEANEAYWGGAPTLKEVEIRFIPEASARVAALRAGEVNMVDRVAPEQAETLEQEGLVVVPMVIGQSLVFHFGRETQRLEPLQDVRVRQALNHAIDLDSIAEDLTLGWARKLQGQLAGPSTVGYNPDVTAFAYDPDKAKDLLAEAGYADGFTVPLKCTQGRYFMDKEVCEVVAAQLAAVGVTAEVELLEPSVFAERFMSNTLDEGGLWTLAPNTFPAMDVAISYPGYTSDHPFKFWANEEFDELFAQQTQTLDPEERLPILQRMAEIMKEEAIGIWIYEIPIGWAMDTHVQGVSLGPDGSIDLSQAYMQ